MSLRLFVLAQHDWRLQYRYGIYLAYSFVLAFYVLVLTTLGANLPAWAVGVIIYSDPAALGFFFLGALMMLERSERVRTALATTPVSSANYALAKFLTLTGASLIACTVLLLVLQHQVTPALLLTTVALTSVCFIGIGIPIALRFRTVNGYLVGSAIFLTPVILPAALALLDPLPTLAWLWPPVAQLRLILVSTGYGANSGTEIALMLLICAFATFGTAWAGVAALRREFGK